jgi:hypothetical protein
LHGDGVRSSEVRKFRRADVDRVGLQSVLPQGVVVFLGTIADLGEIGSEFLCGPYFTVGDVQKPFSMRMRKT